MQQAQYNDAGANVSGTAQKWLRVSEDVQVQGNWGTIMIANLYVLYERIFNITKLSSEQP